MVGILLLIVTSTIGTPYLFYRVIHVCEKYLNTISLPDTKESISNQWNQRVYLSRNSCRTLYSDFNYRWRFYKLFMLFQKLVIVAIFIFAMEIPLVLLFALAFRYIRFST